MTENNLILTFLNSDFSTAFFGAIAGSATILFIDHIKQQNRTLAEVNATLATFSSQLNTLLNMKRQHVVPLVENYKRNVEAYSNLISAKEHEKILIPAQIYAKMFYCPKLQFDYPIDRIFSFATETPHLFSVLIEAKKNIGEVEAACQAWNDIAKQIKDLPQDARAQFYFGTIDKENTTNTIFSDTIMNLNMSLDYSLFFINLSIRKLQEAANIKLPKRLRKKIPKVEILDKEHSALMPPENFKNWG